MPGELLNLHFHVLWLDGAYGYEPGVRPARFWAMPELQDAEVERLVRVVRDRVVRALSRCGKLPSADGGDEEEGVAKHDEAQAELVAAAVQGRPALGERAGERDARVGRTGVGAPRAAASVSGHADTVPFSGIRTSELCGIMSHPGSSLSGLLLTSTQPRTAGHFTNSPSRSTHCRAGSTTTPSSTRGRSPR